MKHLLFLITLLSLLFLGACSTEKQDIANDSPVPEAVKTAFKQAHPQAKAVNWSKEGKYFEAEYEEGKMERAFVYDEKGSLVLTETEIDPSELPGTIVSYLSTNFPEHQVKEVDKIVKGDAVAYDVLFVENGKARELTFDDAGNLIGEEDEGDDDEDDEDDEDGE
jgi:hypothetical protein